MSVRIVVAPSDARAACDAARAIGKVVGFVPTMGALHAGHLALVGEAKRRADFVVVSIFVNPTQFGPSEDFSRYPRDLEGDVSALGPVGADVLFAPHTQAMYREDDQTRVRVGGLAEPLEGACRPGHFDGVATAVAKLFAVAGQCVAVFGRKDYQQLLVVRRMARDLLLPVDIVGYPTVREKDGLAMSSRNRFLTADERSRALCIVQGLDAARRRFETGERRTSELERVAHECVERATSFIDYVAVRDADSLAPLAGEGWTRALIAVACRIGSTRLIDNIVLGEDGSPLYPADPVVTIPSGV